MDITLGIQNMGVHGESQYQYEIRRALLGRGLRRQRPLLAELVPEPYNQHDANAVRVSALVGRRQLRVTVGYMPRDLAAKFQRAVVEANANGDRVVLPMIVIGGTREKPSYGVRIGEDLSA